MRQGIVVILFLIWWEFMWWFKIKESMMAIDFENSLGGFRKGGNCDIGAPQRAQLAGWLLAWHVWLTYPKKLSILSCWGRSVVGLIRYNWGQVCEAAQLGSYFWNRILPRALLWYQNHDIGLSIVRIYSITLCIVLSLVWIWKLSHANCKYIIHHWVI